MSSTDSLPPMIGGRYRPIRLLGQGGMGVVYVVEHAHTGEQLALKLLLNQAGASADRVDRFKRESRASARIKSEHVVRITDADVAPELDGAPFLVMELLDGSDLGAVVGDDPQAPADVVEWMRQIARALDKAHAIGLVHRDIKPENLFLTKREDGSPMLKILDFGLVKMTSENIGATQTGEVLGSPRYMSPEQAKGEIDRLGPACDIWALGIVVYKCLTGDEYWQANSVTHLLAQIVYEPVTPPSARGKPLGSAFDAWFLKSCDRDPEKRFATVGEQAQALGLALGASSGPLSRSDQHDPVPLSRSDQHDAVPLRSIEGAHTLHAATSGISTPLAGSAAPKRSQHVAIAVTAVALVVVAALVTWRVGAPAATPAREAAAAPPSAVAPPSNSASVSPPVTSAPTVAPAVAPAVPTTTDVASARPVDRKPAGKVGAPASPTKAPPSRPANDPLGDQK